MTGLDTRAIRSDELERRPAPAVEHGFRVFIEESAFDRATARGGEDPTREVGGILVGQVYADDAGPYVLVDATIDALHAEEKGTELTITHATWEHVHREMDTRHQGKCVVGWYHTHPGFGIFLSDRDSFIQRSFFNLAHQIALVYDPRSREHGVFVWRDNEPVRAQRYWIGTREHNYEGPPMNANEEAAAPSEPARNAAPSAAGPPLEGDRLALGTIALVLLLVGGIAGWWLGRGSGAGEGTAEARAAERARGAQEVARALNVELLSLLRALLDGDDARRDLDRGIAMLEEAHAKLPTPGEEPGAGLKAGIERVRAYRDMQARAAGNLALLEGLARQRFVDPRQLQQMLSEHRAVLGQLCATVAEQAAAGGDPAAARRLLRLAARVDPAGAPTYAEKAKALAEKR